MEKDAQTKHSRPYAVPHVHSETFKKELQHLINLGVLEPQGTSEWTSPTFIIPKKDGRVRWISNLRGLFGKCPILCLMPLIWHMILWLAMMKWNMQPKTSIPWKSNYRNACPTRYCQLETSFSAQWSTRKILTQSSESSSTRYMFRQSA